MRQPCIICDKYTPNEDRICDECRSENNKD